MTERFIFVISSHKVNNQKENRNFIQNHITRVYREQKNVPINLDIKKIQNTSFDETKTKTIKKYKNKGEKTINIIKNENKHAIDKLKMIQTES